MFSDDGGAMMGARLLACSVGLLGTIGIGVMLARSAAPDSTSGDTAYARHRQAQLDSLRDGYESEIAEQQRAARQNDISMRNRDFEVTLMESLGLRDDQAVP